MVVVGGGFGGVCAAVAAARTGAKTLLLERYGFLGGMATAGLVNPFMTYFAGGKQIIEGIFSEVLEGLGQRGGLEERGRIFYATSGKGATQGPPDGKHFPRLHSRKKTGHLSRDFIEDFNCICRAFGP